ncbi:MAG TPA: hypothetical protein VK454_10235, partial [Myxococcaceae bacterium]|nr:hypothetical protein [Myxococcaceae bacterium]
MGRAFYSNDSDQPGQLQVTRGPLSLAYGLRVGVQVGYLIEYDWDGKTVSFAEPYVRGLQHGWTKQFDPRGRLLMSSPFVRGTGTDFYCHDDGELSEETQWVNGRPIFARIWEDRTSVCSESHFDDGTRHGVWRHWTNGELDSNTKFYVRDEEVSKERYLEVAARDPTVPPYRPEE